jgi:nicotinate-nucleotide adenylyltransferase
MTANNQNRITPIRIGLFGGTFNPIHQGHTQVAEEVLQHYALDQVIFIPSAVPPHKSRQAVTGAEHRLVMTRLALDEKRHLQVSDIEIQRQGPSYTIDTLRWFKQPVEQPCHFFFMVGIDAFLEIHTWKAYLQLFEETAFIIMSRPQSGQPFPDLSGAVVSYVCTHISKDYHLSADRRVLLHPAKHPLYLATVTAVDIASSHIRDAVRRGEGIDRWVDPAVAQYIKDKGLYR